MGNPIIRSAEYFECHTNAVIGLSKDESVVTRWELLGEGGGAGYNEIKQYSKQKRKPGKLDHRSKQYNYYINTFGDNNNALKVQGQEKGGALLRHAIEDQSY